MLQNPGFLQDSLAPSSVLYQNTGIEVPYRKIVFATDYHFQDTAIRDVKHALEEELNEHGITAKCDWRRDASAFILTCHCSEVHQVRDSLFTILSAIIKSQETASDESNDSYSSDDDDSTEERSQSEIEEQNIGDQAGITSLAKLRKRTKLFKVAGATVSDFPSLISEYNFQSSWICSSDFDLVASQENLDDIGRRTGTALVRDKSLPMVYIGSETEQDYHKVVTKLDNLLKYSMISPTSKHVFYAENVENYKVSLRFLIDCKKRLFETTLLDNYQHYDQLQNVVVAKMVIFNIKTQECTPFKEDKYLPVGDNLETMLRDWQDYKYPAHGTMGTFPQPKKTNNQSLEDESNTSKVAEDEEPESVRSQVAINATKSWIQDLPEVSIVPVVDMPEGDHSGKWDSYVQCDAEISTISADYLSSAAGIGHDPNVELIMSSTVSDLVQPDNHRDNQSALPEHDKQTSLLDEDDECLKRLNFALLTPSKVGDCRGPDINASASSIQQQRKIIADNEPLIDLEDVDLKAREALVEVLQTKDEVNSRQYHETMNQKAGKNKRAQKVTFSQSVLAHLETPESSSSTNPSTTQTNDPSLEFQKTVSAHVKEIAGRLQGYHGPINIQATFGRILLASLPAQHVQSGSNDTAGSPDVILKLLEEPTVTTYLTKVLTSSVQDIHFLIDLAIDDQRIWEVCPASRDCFYEFHYQLGLSEEKFCIKIKADSLNSTIETEEDLGSINAHAPKRRWDFAIQFQGFRRKPQHNDLAEAIKQDLYVPGDQMQPQIQFKVPSILEKKYKLVCILVHRVCEYRSSTENTNLKVSEIYDLDILSTTVSDVHMFTAKSHVPPRSPAETLSRWFEVAIVCPALADRTKENDSIELGTEAAWTPEHIAHDLEETVNLACQMLKMMDSVGHSNNNGLKVEAAPTPVQPPEEEFKFW